MDRHRSISVSLDEGLLRDLDKEMSQGTHATHQNRSADLATLEGGDLDAARQAAQPLFWRQQATAGAGGHSGCIHSPPLLTAVS